MKRWLPLACGLSILSGCNLLSPLLGDADGLVAADTLRRIEVEIDDPTRGLPCRVVYWPDAETRDVLWHARFEKGFCHQKAEEARQILEARGWACEIDSSETTPISSSTQSERHVVEAWHCRRRPEDESTVTWRPTPPRPAAPSASVQNAPQPIAKPALRTALSETMASLGSAIASLSVVSAVAYGDLDRDSQEDAVIVLTHQPSDRVPKHLLLVYQGDGQAYSFVDVEVVAVVAAGRDWKTGELTADIDDGVIRLLSCCSDDRELAAFELRHDELEPAARRARSPPT